MLENSSLRGCSEQTAVGFLGCEGSGIDDQSNSSEKRLDQWGKGEAEEGSGGCQNFNRRLPQTTPIF